MDNLKKYFEKIEIAINNLEGSHKKLIEAKKNIELKKKLEDTISKLRKEKIASVELIDQALEEIKLLRTNVIKNEENDG
ncbi:MAG: hypothetical protein CMJ06_05670 [Pelagibacterales bacterium]|nr:hypothetical protein [Pelagibacterales bacterium]OUU61412.1 MAG: hypothetical protein CBC22_07735 [Alphaproteobacteria bacterium TMED62]|tara:strand:+ start:15581 stop:15817 length:237 start_codon:yes stop_codon:yes gene_type:complete